MDPLISQLNSGYSSAYVWGGGGGGGGVVWCVETQESS